MLGAEEGFFTKLVPAAVGSLSAAFPELAEQQDHVQVVKHTSETPPRHLRGTPDALSLRLPLPPPLPHRP